MEEAAAGERLKSEGHQGKILYDRTNVCWYAAKFLAQKSHWNHKNYYFFRNLQIPSYYFKEQSHTRKFEEKKIKIVCPKNEQIGF